MDWKENQPIPFELNVPQKAAKSYKGKYSEVIWEIKSKVDIPLKNDLNAVATIVIIWLSKLYITAIHFRLLTEKKYYL